MPQWVGFAGLCIVTDLDQMYNRKTRARLPRSGTLFIFFHRRPACIAHRPMPTRRLPSSRARARATAALSLSFLSRHLTAGSPPLLVRAGGRAFGAFVELIITTAGGRYPAARDVMPACLPCMLLAGCLLAGVRWKKTSSVHQIFNKQEKKRRRRGSDVLPVYAMCM